MLPTHAHGVRRVGSWVLLRQWRVRAHLKNLADCEMVSRAAGNSPASCSRWSSKASNAFIMAWLNGRIHRFSGFASASRLRMYLVAPLNQNASTDGQGTGPSEHACTAREVARVKENCCVEDIHAVRQAGKVHPARRTAPQDELPVVRHHLGLTPVHSLDRLGRPPRPASTPSRTRHPRQRRGRRRCTPPCAWRVNQT